MNNNDPLRVIMTPGYGTSTPEHMVTRQTTQQHTHTHTHTKTCEREERGKDAEGKEEDKNTYTNN